MKWPDDLVDQVVCADVMDFLSEVPDESVQCCITSPPYWGLRDYEGLAKSFGRLSMSKRNTRLHLYTDGCSRGNPGPACAGIVITTPRDEIVRSFSERIGVVTNNVSEYSAVTIGLACCAKILGGTPDRPVGSVRCHSDSKLVVKHMTGKWRVKAGHLKEYKYELQRLIQCFQDVKFKWVPRSTPRIQLCDQLANEECDPFEREIIAHKAGK